VRASEKCFEEYDDDRVKRCEKSCKGTLDTIKEVALEDQRTGKAGVIKAILDAQKEAREVEEDCKKGKKDSEIELLVYLVERAKDPEIIQWLIDQ
jgi:hypothetical protein